MNKNVKKYLKNIFNTNVTWPRRDLDATQTRPKMKHAGHNKNAHHTKLTRTCSELDYT